MCCVDKCLRKEYHIDEDGKRYCKKHGIRFKEINPKKIKVKPVDIINTHWISVISEREINHTTYEVKFIRSKDPYVNGYIPVYKEHMIKYWMSLCYNVNHVIC